MFRPFVLVIMALVVTSCATLQTEPEPVTDESHTQWQQHLEQLSQYQNWSIRGRVALFVEEDVYNLGLDWKRDGDLSQIKLEAALGQGMIELYKKNKRVKLTTAKGEKYEGNNAQQVLYQSTGLSFPVEGLETWIKGIPHESTLYLPDINAAGQALSIQQDGWTINYFNYQAVEFDQHPDRQLPGKIYMKHDKLALKIVIDQWQPPVDQSPSELFPSFR